jgi:hypothetical protein
MSPTNMRKPCGLGQCGFILGRGGVAYWLEGLDLGLLSSVVDGVLHVIDGEAAPGRLKLVVSELRDPLVAAVLCPEIHDCCPVVGEIVAELACCAGRFGGQVSARIHSGVEGVLCGRY